MLSVSDLVVRYGQITALDRVSILVREGEAVGVVGPNGAGKSSLLAAITGRLCAGFSAKIRRSWPSRKPWVNACTG